jgi:hypothetical protein
VASPIPRPAECDRADVARLGDSASARITAAVVRKPADRQDRPNSEASLQVLGAKAWRIKVHQNQLGKSRHRLGSEQRMTAADRGK